MATRPADTVPIVRLLLMVDAMCPACGTKLSIHSEILEEVLVTGGAMRIIDTTKSELVDRLSRRGWTKEMCGKCRDQE